MTNHELNQKISSFNSKIATDAKFAERAQNDPAKALAECGIEIDKHKVTIEVKIDDETVNHFVLPHARDFEALSDDDLAGINAAKKHVLVKASTFGCFFGCLGSADIANTKGKNVLINN